MENSTAVTTAFLQLPIMHQEGIARIMQRSGEGYAMFLERELDTMAEYNHFCCSALGVVAIEWSKVCQTQLCILLIRSIMTCAADAAIRPDKACFSS